MPSITKALNEGVNAAGGFLVPDEFSNRLLALIKQKAVVMDDLDRKSVV